MGQHIVCVGINPDVARLFQLAERPIVDGQTKPAMSSLISIRPVSLPVFCGTTISPVEIKEYVL